MCVHARTLLKIQSVTFQRHQLCSLLLWNQRPHTYQCKYGFIFPQLPRSGLWVRPAWPYAQDLHRGWFSSCTSAFLASSRGHWWQLAPCRTGFPIFLLVFRRGPLSVPRGHPAFLCHVALCHNMAAHFFKLSRRSFYSALPRWSHTMYHSQSNHLSPLPCNRT